MGKNAHDLGRDFERAGQAIGLDRDADRRMAVEQKIIAPCDQGGEFLRRRGRIRTADNEFRPGCAINNF